MDAGKERIAGLVVQLQSGDNKAFNELYKLTSGRAYFVALEITKNEQDAEDVLQESYIKMLDKIGTLDKPESFVSWFHHMVANKSKDSLKKKKPSLFTGGEEGDEDAFEVIADEDTAFSPEDNLNQEELHTAIMEVLDELTEEKRACIMMMYFEEMSVNEISQSLEIPVSTVKNRLFTARKDLKAKFEKRGITTLYSTAPIGVVIWALARSSDKVSAAFAESAASAKVLAGVGMSGGAVAVAATAEAGTAATVVASSAAVTSVAATSGAGVAGTGMAVTGIFTKVIAGIVVTAVVGGTATGVVTVVKNRNSNKTYTELQVESTTAPESETALAAIAGVSETQSTSEMSSETLPSTTESTTGSEPSGTTATKPTTTKKTTTTTKKTTTTTKKTTTTTKKPTTTTTKPTTTTTKPTTTTTKPTTTTTKPTTTTTKPTTTTTKPTTTTTTKAADATVTIVVYELDDSVADTFSFTVAPGTVLNEETVTPYVEARGHTPYGGYIGTSDSKFAESGASYTINAYL